MKTQHMGITNKVKRGCQKTTEGILKGEKNLNFRLLSFLFSPLCSFFCTFAPANVGIYLKIRYI